MIVQADASPTLMKAKQCEPRLVVTLQEFESESCVGNCPESGTRDLSRVHSGYTLVE